MRFGTYFILCFLPLTICQGQDVSNLSTFFERSDEFFSTEVKEGKIDYGKVKGSTALDQLMAFIEDFDYEKLQGNVKKAYLINVYNLLVIDGVRKAYPIQSTLKIYGFFDRQKREVGSRQWTLDELEKSLILPSFTDPRMHFALACAAVSCPSLASFAYTPQRLEDQLNQRTRLALNDPHFVRVRPASSSRSDHETFEKVALSKIFEWYAEDFGEDDETIIQYINHHRDEKLSLDLQIEYYPYDWTLNDLGNDSRPKNANRYVVSSAIPQGGVEIKWFNNLYTQKVPPPTFSQESRESYFTALINFVYGITDRFNLGFDVRYRRISLHETPASPLKIFSFSDAARSRSALATFGPKVRIAPNANWPNFSIQSALWFPLKSDLTAHPWLDWDGPTWWTQAFNDFDVGSDFSLFTELDILIEDMGQTEKGRLNRFSTPITGIFSYFPTSVSTIYFLANLSPYWSPDLDYFFQTGVGAKYQLSNQLEVELLYTYFTNDYIQEISARAATINIGVRYSRW